MISYLPFFVLFDDRNCLQKFPCSCYASGNLNIGRFVGNLFPNRAVNILHQCRHTEQRCSSLRRNETLLCCDRVWSLWDHDSVE